MNTKRVGQRTVALSHPPSVLSCVAVGGKFEKNGPLGSYFDATSDDSFFGEKTWEKAESAMQKQALQRALDKARLKPTDLDYIFAGDLLNQCIGSSFSLREFGIPFYGLYGACSTMGESLSLAAMMIDGGFARKCAAMTSSHFCTAERQYRMPVPYGSQRPPTAQWTATAAGCTLLAAEGDGPCVTHVTCGKIVDLGIKDANNMGAAMAPAAYETIRAHFDDLRLTPEDYDLIVTGDLGKLGKEILIGLFDKDGVRIGGRYDDCGTMIFDLQKQDVHAGGSGCGCSAVVLCGYLLQQMQQKKIKNLLFCGTGALLSPLTSQQGESIPGVCHAVSIGTERR